MDKKYNIKITPYAEQSMREISEYITYELMAPYAAVNLMRTLQREINSLRLIPNRVHLTPEEPWHSEGVHRMKVKNFYVYFWVDEDCGIVHVTDVIYIRRDQKRRLEDMPL